VLAESMWDLTDERCIQCGALLLSRPVPTRTAQSPLPARVDIEWLCTDGCQGRVK
jgi:hypothetical protein